MEANETINSPNWLHRRNWWKIAFFVLLVVFEFTREIAVLSSDTQPKVTISASVNSIQDYTSARGRWIRIDGGDKLVPAATSISCDQSEGRCIEATAKMLRGHLTEPKVDIFSAKFSPDTISYINDFPLCVRYNVRIDLKLKKAFAVRERKPQLQNEMCEDVEERIEMTLGDGYQKDDDQLGGHFVPFIQMIGLLSR